MLEQKPYPKITVSELCSQADVSRNTFYALYDDKDCLIQSLFQQHVFDRIWHTRNLFQPKELFALSDRLHQQFYTNIYKEKEYYMNLVCPLQKCGDNTFMRTIARVIHSYDLKMIEVSGKDIAPWEAEYIALFYSASQAALTQKWIADKMVVPVEDISEATAKMVLPFWDRLFS